MSSLPAQIIAFVGNRSLGCGAPADIALKIKTAADKDADVRLLIFDAATSRPVEIDLRGTLADVQKRLAIDAATPLAETEVAAPRGPGRPKLGVVAREVTLLPRHWEWLSQQPGGASVALRKLVEEARRVSSGKDRAREAQETVYRFMTAMAGDYPQYEDALRSLYAGDRTRFDTSIEKWPVDVRDHVRRLAADAFVTV
ncbi:MAG: DUF2239 family protein [Afipia sp.]